jgi:hypothetical protein
MSIKALAMCAVAAVCLVMTGTASATIVCEYTGSGSGKLGEVQFGMSNFTITAFIDPANCTEVRTGVFAAPNDSATISIAGLGTFDFLVPTKTLANSSSGHLSNVSFEYGTGLDLYAVNNLLAPSWNMQEAIPTVTGIGQLMQWTYQPMYTTGGTLVFSNTYGPTGTFNTHYSSSPVPEPMTMAAVGMGLAGLGGYIRRRRAAAK